MVLLLAVLLAFAAIIPVHTARAESFGAWVQYGSLPYTPNAQIQVENGEIYAAYQEGSSFRVAKYDGESWVNLGSVSAYNNQPKFSFVVKGGTPYLAYQIGSSKINVAYHNGTTWTQIGSSVTPYYNTTINNVGLNIADNGDKYFITNSKVNDIDNVVIYKYENNGWVRKKEAGRNANRNPLGMTVIGDKLFGFVVNSGILNTFEVYRWIGDSAPSSVSIQNAKTVAGYAIKGDYLYVVYGDGKYSGKLSVKRLDLSAATLVFEDVGNQGFDSNDSPVYPDIGFVNDTPFVVYSKSKTLQMAELVDGTWVPADTPAKRSIESSSNKWLNIAMEGESLYLVYPFSMTSSLIFEYFIPVGRDVLQSTIEEAESLTAGKYTQDSWASLRDALNAAKAVMANAEASQKDINASNSALRNAIIQLVREPGRAALDRLVRQAYKKVEQNPKQNKYTPSSWQLFMDALNNAIAILNDYTVPIEQVNAAIDALDIAMEGLTPQAKRSVANAVLEQAKTLTPDDVKNWDELQEAIKETEEFANDPEVDEGALRERVLRLAVIAGIISDFPDIYYLTGTPDEDDNRAYIYGMVDPAILSAEVTLSAYFHIAPNAPEGERFISPDITVKNTSTMPIYVDAAGMTATGDAPKVVARDKYTDQEWSRLGASETVAYIALGLTGTPSAGDFYFTGEESQSPVRIDENLLSQNTDVLGLQAKFGLSWPAAQSYKYELVFALGLRN